jgi:protoheme IX farnesyltransferase
VSLETFILFAIIFLWTPPHFWALALVKSADYARAGIPMLPNVAGPAATRRQILLYTLVLAPFAVLPALMGFASPVYGVVAAVSGGAMILYAVRLLRAPDTQALRKACGKLFGFSILYLFLLFAVLLAEQLVGVGRIEGLVSLVVHAVGVAA